MPPHAATIWTARASFAFYILALVLRFLDRPRPARDAWTVGFGAFVAHMIAAFHFEHHWSHADAYEATAQKTAAVAGLDWGGGLYANYLLAILWACDVVGWQRRLHGYRARPRSVEVAVQSYIAFLWFNATVVFGVGPIRWLGALGFAFLGILAVRSLFARPGPSGYTGGTEVSHATDAHLPDP